MTLPGSMRVIEVGGGFGGPETLRVAELPVPVPGPCDVLIRVAAAGVNRPDIMQRKGLYPPPPDASPILGLEVAGEVVALGADSSRVRLGDKICALANGGGHAEYCAVPETQCLPWPAGFDAAQAAALPETFFTVWANLFGLGRLRAGESVLVHGGAGGIGTAAIQMARAFGATVFATAGSAEKCQFCRSLGATAAIDYGTEDFVARIADLTAGRGVDVVLDMIGGPYLSRNLRSLATDGRLVVIAVQGGRKDPDFDLLPVMLKRLTITGSTLRPRSRPEKGAIAAALLQNVWPQLEVGEIKPVIDAVYPLAEAAEAHRRMETGGHTGKILLRVPG